MKLAYLILAHKNPMQLARMISRLLHSQTYFFIHVDKKTGLQDFVDALKYYQIPEDKVVFSRKRVKVYWGHFSIVEATLYLIEEALVYSQTLDYFILLSGQDYPLQPNNKIISFFEENAGKNFIEHTPMPAAHLWGGGMHRLNNYHYLFNGKLRTYPFPDTGKRAYVLNLMMRPFFSLPRKHPENLIPYTGSQWWSLNSEALNHIYSFVGSRPDFLSYHRKTKIADAIFFQTILMNASSVHLLESIHSDNLRLINWKEKNMPSPEDFTLEDLPLIKASDRLYGRKFALPGSEKILNEIDSMIL